MQEPNIGILLKYPKNQNKLNSKVSLPAKTAASEKVIAGFIGAGSFAQSYLIPNVKLFGGYLHTVVNARGITSKNVAQKFGFAQASSNAHCFAEVFLMKN